MWRQTVPQYMWWKRFCAFHLVRFNHWRSSPAASSKKGITKGALNHWIVLTWSYKWKFPHHDVIKKAFCFLERAIAPHLSPILQCSVSLLTLLTSTIFLLLFSSLFFHIFFPFLYLTIPPHFSSLQYVYFLIFFPSHCLLILPLQ